MFTFCLTVDEMKTKIVSVRVPYTLYDKLQDDGNTKTYTITKALTQYFRSKEPNQQIFTKCNTNVYNQDLVSSLNDQITFLQDQITFLHQQNAYLSLPWYKKIMYQLEGKK